MIKTYLASPRGGWWRRSAPFEVIEPSAGTQTY